MDPQSQLASREDVWRLQNEMKNVYATQAEHADRIMRLERHHAEDSRMKSVWGGQSPFPSILNGSAQQGTFAVALTFNTELTCLCRPRLQSSG